MIEILSPAGGMESVTAAVLNGADAVYLGQKGFSARQNAENFDEAALKQAVDFCHLYGVKVYQTVNTIIFDEEMDSLQETLQAACDAKVDALIVQDFGVLELARRTCPQMPLHGSTQMTVHTVKGAEVLKQMGLSRVVVAREMTLLEIKEIIDTVGIEVEVFVHGALCMSVSGQCYMSAAIGGRSGNKGNCAGSCRLPFRVLANPKKEAYDLSLKDLCLAEYVKELEEIGVASLKIEGRMKRPEYVAATTRAYRNVKEEKPADTEELRAVFSRNGFTDGYLTGKISGEMFGFRGKEDVTAATNEIFSRLQETYRKPKQVFPVSMEFWMEENLPATLRMTDGEGHIATAEGEIPQQARVKPTTGEMARESLGKLGDTPYGLAQFESHIGEGLMLPKSKLNELRRMAVERLHTMRTEREEIPFQRVVLEEQETKRAGQKPAYRLRFANYEQLPFAYLKRVEAFSLPAEQVWKHREELLVYRDRLWIEPDRILFGREKNVMEGLQRLKEVGFLHLAVSNLAHIGMGKELGFVLHGTHFLNCSNSLSVGKYAELGLCDMVLSMEGTVGQLSHIRAGEEMQLGAVIYGQLPLMILRNCPVKRYVSCQDCRSRQGLTDRLGNTFPVVCHQRKYSEVLNCKTLHLADRQKDFAAFSFLELYFTTESAAACEQVIETFFRQEKGHGDYTKGLYYRGIN